MCTLCAVLSSWFERSSSETSRIAPVIPVQHTTPAALFVSANSALQLLPQLPHCHYPALLLAPPHRGSVST